MSVLNVATRTYPNGGNVGAQIFGYVGPITGARDQGQSQRGLPDRLDYR